MATFFHERNIDSLLTRKAGSKELPLVEINRLRKQLQEQQAIVECLDNENRHLHRELEKLQQQLATMTFVHDMDELIDAMKQDKKADSEFTSSLSELFKFKKVSNSDSDDSDKVLEQYVGENGTSEMAELSKREER